ncbi:MAG: polyprenyl synthetase family protein [Nitrospinae bacterium]|nr:polyprenyl synthetase family protein [Nitrospinota bacterium]
MQSNLKSVLDTKKAAVEGALGIYSSCSGDGPAEIHEAMGYSLFSNGKRIRPILALLTSEAVGGSEEETLPAACAMEMIHTASLILDDLPCMDNASYRRGIETCHRKFGESTAILASMALLNKAYRVLAEWDASGKKGERLKLQVLKEIPELVGPAGIIGGQIADLASEGKALDFEALEYIHSRKTGSLFIGSIRIGAIIGGASEQELRAATNFAKNLGLAFQIQDDILDETGDLQSMGKEGKMDKRRSNFVSFCGVDKASEIVRELTGHAVLSLQIFGDRARWLKEAAYYLAVRDH